MATLAAFAMVAAACQSTAAPSAGAGAGSGETMYIIAPSLTDPFWITQKNGADQAGKDFGVKVVFQAPAQDTGDAGMESLARAAVAAKPAGIAIDFTSKTMEAVTKEALDAGIKVVLYNNNRFEGENAPSDPRIPGLAFVGQNEAVSGEILGKAWIPNLKTPGCKVLIMNPFPTAFVLTLRADGMKRALDAAGFTHEDLA
ncbi:MAG TPA: substrate-binding domain-containing protein, partial [Candidatus Limnocylindrales bacterium]|nr:substrate-binding domain-containing protein [Candidatus Limnocylindrales bacterium]